MLPPLALASTVRQSTAHGKMALPSITPTITPELAAATLDPPGGNMARRHDLPGGNMARRHAHQNSMAAHQIAVTMIAGTRLSGMIAAKTRTRMRIRTRTVIPGLRDPVPALTTHASVNLKVSPLVNGMSMAQAPMPIIVEIAMSALIVARQMDAKTSEGSRDILTDMLIRQIARRALHDITTVARVLIRTDSHPTPVAHVLIKVDGHLRLVAHVLIKVVNHPHDLISMDNHLRPVKHALLTVAMTGTMSRSNLRVTTSSLTPTMIVGRTNIVKIALRHGMLSRRSQKKSM